MSELVRLRSRVRFLRISLTFSQLSEHQSQSVILHCSSNRNLQLSGSLQKSLSLFTSVITLSTCFCSDNQSQWKSFLRVCKGYSLDLGSWGWSHCQHLKCCWLVETPWGPVLAAYPLSRAKMLSSRSRLQMGASFLSKMALKWKSALFVSSMEKNPKLSAYSGHDLHVHRPNRLNTPTRHPCVLHHLHLWFF